MGAADHGNLIGEPFWQCLGVLQGEKGDGRLGGREGVQNRAGSGDGKWNGTSGGIGESVCFEFVCCLKPPWLLHLLLQVAHWKSVLVIECVLRAKTD